MNMSIFLTSSAWVTKIVSSMILARFFPVAFFGCWFGMISCPLTYSVLLRRTCIFILSAILCKSYTDFLSWRTTKFSFRWALIWRLTWVSLIAITECWLDTSIVDNSMLSNALARITSHMIFAMIGAGNFTITFSFDMSRVGTNFSLKIGNFFLENLLQILKRPVDVKRSSDSKYASLMSVSRREVHEF